MESPNEYDTLKASLYDRYFNGVEGDIAFYVAEATREKGVVLELGCGTGRITFPLAEAGINVIGIDTSEDMLAIARAKLTQSLRTISKHITLLNADFRSFTLTRKVRTAIIPYRAFMHLMTPQDQVQTLLNIRAHLYKHGRLVFDIFEPSRELHTSGASDTALRFDTEFTHPKTGSRVMAWYTRQIDIINQVIYQKMLFEELNESGTVISRTYSPLTLRYSHRYEVHYLLELCGFKVEQLYGDFHRGYFIGGDQIWVARVT